MCSSVPLGLEQMLLANQPRCQTSSCQSHRLYLSDSPIHFDTRSDDETEKKVELASVATALARNDLPVPGGPYSKMPFQGVRLPNNLFGRKQKKSRTKWVSNGRRSCGHRFIHWFPWIDQLPVKRWGNLMGRMTASFNDSLAASNPATSDHFTLGFSVRIAEVRAPLSFLVSASSSSSSSLSFFLQQPSGYKSVHPCEHKIGIHSQSTSRVMFAGAIEA